MNNIIAVVAVVFAGALFFQNTSPDIPTYTIGSGGGTSTGGGYTLSGTVGQPSVGVAIGGGYTLSGGFWPQVYAVGVDLEILVVMPTELGSDPNTDLTITFSLPVQKGTGNIVISSGGQTIETIDVQSAQVTINSNVVTIDPAALLNFGTTYTVTVPAGASRTPAATRHRG